MRLPVLMRKTGCVFAFLRVHFCVCMCTREQILRHIPAHRKYKDDQRVMKL